MSAAITGLAAAGRREWPDLAVDGAALAVHIARQIAPETIDLQAALATIRAADLCLAFACATNTPGALDAFERTCSAAINGVIAAIDHSRSPRFRAEVRQALQARLFVGSADSPPRIGSYAGRGPLTAWVAIVTQRLALSMRRTEKTRERIEDRAAAEADAHPDAQAQDPELAYLKQRYRGDFEAAYRAALAALPERDRTLMRLNLVDGVTLERLGAMFGVNASTVSRWLDKARAAIRDATEQHLRGHLEVSNSEFASLARLVVSQLDVSIAALFDVPGHRS